MAVAGLLLASLASFVFAYTRPDGLSHIYFFDIGQGDASLIVTSDHRNILIDGGPDSEVVNKLAEVLPPWERDIDLMILTHPHADHVRGLIDVVSQYQVHEFWFNGTDHDTATYKELLATVKTRGIPTKTIAAPYEQTVGNARLSVISPWSTSVSGSDPNETSIVTLIDVGAFRALFTGDASVDNEADMLSRKAVPNIDVLKVPHQGSHTSSSPEFIKAADPEVAVIMVGANNDYGHPHADVLDRYSDLGVRLFRTDHDGTVEVVTDGTTYKVLD